MPEKYTSLYEVLSTWFGGAFATLFVAFLGRAMWHGNEARKGRRRFFGPELIWEIPVAFGMAFIGEGVASYFGVPQPASTGLIAVLSYLGPRGTEVLLQKWVSRKSAT
ncbi:phage holin family protein [Agrobacterium genomosp. 3 str. CIP 111-78]|uniref:LydA holin phage, holin superfamily III n=1 Tax=Agrobacterium tumefaciens TaxID=358 RepID=A0AAE6ELY6_AGRTU|nr:MULTISPECIES: phage holin family protein [Agrobacterium tumefaciens complex]MCA2372189.1 phage holin family protein [Agrobacterium tomkonis CIP 111-78]QCM02060.1 hypothetical protein CFBP6624_17755 [Agrobacterium tumefaciens]